MGKYDELWEQLSTDEASNKLTRNSILFSIANELAESNRLKRLELKITTNPYLFKSKKDYDKLFVKELEDKA